MRIQRETEQIIPHVTPELTVEHGGEQSTLDMLADISSTENSWRTFFLIEAERHMPNYSTWLFLKPAKPRNPKPPYLVGYGIFQPEKRIDTYSGVSSQRFVDQRFITLLKQEFQNFSDAFEYGNIAFEIKSGSDEAKTDGISKVCKDVTIATHAMTMETAKRSTLSGEDGVANKVFFIPIVVTTAKIGIAETNVERIPLDTGTIEPQNFNVDDKPWMVYEYTVPANLLLPMEAGRYTWSSEREDRLRRRHVFIVNANHYTEFLQRMSATNFA